MVGFPYIRPMEFERLSKKSIQKTSERQRSRKILLFLYATLFGVAIIVVRLFYLQIHQGTHLCKLGERNFLRTEVIPSERGNVYDSEHRLLATNRPVFDLRWYGSGAFSLAQDQRDFINKIRLILGAEVVDDLLEKQIERSERFSRQLLVKSDITRDQLCKISEQCAESQNLSIERRFKRIYPFNSLASHILGYLRQARESHGVQGLYGLERLFQDDLQGETGYVQHVINATGKKLFTAEQKEAQAGSDVTLTLDLDMQKIAENLFSPGQSGAFIIMDPKDGAIKVMLSYPNFDPNLFLKPISQEVWQNKFYTDSPLLNRAIHAAYPPASIFKLVTFTAGLEEGVITTETEFDCKGYTLFAGRKYNCQRRWGHGLQSAQKALGVSCNIPCYEIAQQISIDQLAVHAMRLGLGQSTGFLFHDKSGLVPTMGWKQAVHGERWWQGETLSVSIGQSSLLVTPLQIVRMISAICSGYLVKPRILLDEEIIRYPLYVSQKTIEFLQDVMGEVVKRGTAKRMKVFEDFSIHAKTGTAQIVSLAKQKKGAKNQLEHAWFSSYFSYKNEKPLAMVVLVENAGSSRPALKIAENFFKRYQELLREKE
ncbi:penicillin-binding protein 2 [Candidatus Babeliales bacterium]|nr:penicillin-binding protein 2 [Candidatus Babeliales bacterium]